MKKLYSAVQILATIGIMLAIYLLYQQAYQPAYSPCYLNATVNCDAIIKGAVSKTVGIPTPLIGLVGYILVLYSALKHKRQLLMGMTSFGITFCSYIFYQEIFIIKTLCPVCILCIIDMLSVFILSLIINQRSTD